VILLGEGGNRHCRTTFGGGGEEKAREAILERERLGWNCWGEKGEETETTSIRDRMGREK